MKDLSAYSIMVLWWSHRTAEREIKFFEANEKTFVVENLDRVRRHRDELWAEIERRMDLIPSVELMECIETGRILVIH